MKFIYPLLLGWFNDRPVAIPEYNWYGAYGNDADAENGYKDALELDYVFDYPKMHDVVRELLLNRRDKIAHRRYRARLKGFGQVW